MKSININYKDNKIVFNQPIEGEEFKYTILLDKKNNIKNKDYTLCSFTKSGKMAYYTDYVNTSDQEVSYELDFENNIALKGYEDFEVLILAEEINNGKMMILSEVYSPTKSPTGEKEKETKETRTALIVVIVILVVALIVGGIILFLYLRRLKSRSKSELVGKTTSVEDIDSAGTGENLVESQASEKQWKE